MIRIAKKLEFMKTRAVKVCTKEVTENNPGHDNPGFRVNLQQNCLKGKILESSRRFLQNYWIRMKKIMFCERLNGKCQVKLETVQECVILKSQPFLLLFP